MLRIQHLMTFDQTLIAFGKLAPGESSEDPVSFEVASLFHQLRVPLYRYLTYMSAGHQDAEDISQEAFLLLFDHLKAGRPRTNLRGWVFRVAGNLARKRHRRKTAPLCDEALALVDPKPSPEEVTLVRNIHIQLARVFRALPERDQLCLILRAEGLNYREIAAALDLSVGTVASSLARALGRMSEARKGVVK